MTLDGVEHLSSYDRKQVCVPRLCQKKCRKWGRCSYHQFLKRIKSVHIDIQICNHNYLLADLMHRYQGMPPLLSNYRALIIDEAHKLPDTARQMFADTLDGYSGEESHIPYVPTRKREAALRMLQNNIARLLQKDAPTLSELFRHMLEESRQNLKLFCTANTTRLRYIEYDRNGNPDLYTAKPEITENMHHMLWKNQELPVILTSGTMAAQPF